MAVREEYSDRQLDWRSFEGWYGNLMQSKVPKIFERGPNEVSKKWEQWSPNLSSLLTKWSFLPALRLGYIVGL